MPMLGVMSVREETNINQLDVSVNNVWEIGTLTLCLAWAEMKSVNLSRID